MSPSLIDERRKIDNTNRIFIVIVIDCCNNYYSSLACRTRINSTICSYREAISPLIVGGAHSIYNGINMVNKVYIAIVSAVAVELESFQLHLETRYRGGEEVV